MYKILIVDDEALVLTSLKAIINWENYGFRVMDEANNGIEAYQKILNDHPDLVFTDIRMPGMTGLELIKKAKDQNLHTQFVVISGYAEFAYAQRALNYGALGFCLKPFHEDEITSILVKSRTMLDKDRISDSIELLSLIDNNESDNKSKRIKILKSHGLDIDKGIITIVSIGMTELEFDNGMLCIKLKTGKYKNAYIIQNDDASAAEIYSAGTLPKDINGIGISSMIFNYDELGGAFKEAESAAYQYFITGKAGIYANIKTESNEYEILLHKLKDNIINKNIQEAKKDLSSLLILFEGGLCSIKQALKVYNTVMYFLYRSDEEKFESFLSTYDQLVDMFRKIQDMFAYLKGLLCEYDTFNPGFKTTEVKNETFKAVLQFIHENFSKEISIHEIAMKFSVNSSYLSQLFKRETGETLIDYITWLRISYAENLIKNTVLPISEISEKSGYNDYFYFTRVFKKATGITPTGYRAAEK